MRTTRIPDRRYLLLSPFSADWPWMLAVLATALITGSTAVMVAFWAALAARFITDWLATKVNLDDLHGGEHGNELIHHRRQHRR